MIFNLYHYHVNEAYPLPIVLMSLCVYFMVGRSANKFIRSRMNKQSKVNSFSNRGKCYVSFISRLPTFVETTCNHGTPYSGHNVSPPTASSLLKATSEHWKQRNTHENQRSKNRYDVPQIFCHYLTRCGIPNQGEISHLLMCWTNHEYDQMFGRFNLPEKFHFRKLRHVITEIARNFKNNRKYTIHSAY
jgi:hypothetical protein